MFDEIIDRKHNNCLKYDFAAQRGKPEGLLPLWIADMDFRVAQPIIEALSKACQHGIFGYSESTHNYFTAIQQWYQSRHQWCPQEDWLVKAPGAVYAMAVAIRTLTQKGDCVIIQTPVYPPFFETVLDNGRTLITNPLIYEDGQYKMDLADFEAKIIRHKIKLFLFCSPHNPVGRVWTAAELKDLADICLKHQVVILSDELHSDFVYPGHTHHVLAKLDPAYEDITITCTAPSKTFNIAGMQVANIFIANPQLRSTFQKEYAASGYSQLNALGLVACEAAYKEGAPWLDDLLVYLQENLSFVRQFLANNLPQIRLVEPQGTFLLWLDCHGLGLKNQKELDDFITYKAGLWLNSGTSFGPEGLQFQRLNMACPRATLEKALVRLEQAAHTL